MSPVYEHRRITITAAEIAGLVQTEMVRRGMPHEMAAASQYLWVGTPAGVPELHLIVPGYQA